MNKLLVLFFLTIVFFSCGKEGKTPEFSHSSINQKQVPLFVNHENPDVLHVKISVPDTGKTHQLNSATFYFRENNTPGILKSAQVKHLKNGEEQYEPIANNGLQVKDNKAELELTAQIDPETIYFLSDFRLKTMRCLLKAFLFNMWS